MTSRLPTGRRREGLARPLLALTRPYRLHLAALVVFSFTGSMLEAGFLVVVTNVTLAIAEGKGDLTLIPGFTFPVGSLVLAAAVVLVLRLLLAVSSVWLSASTSKKVLVAQRERLTRSYLSADWSTQHSEAAGRLQQLLVFAGNSSAMVGTGLGVVTAGLSLVAFLATALFVSPLATGMVVVGLAALSAVLVPLRRWIQRRADLGAQRSLQFARSIAELGSLGMAMQTFGVREKFTQRIDELSRRDARAALAVDVLKGEVGPVYSFLAYCALLGGVTAAQSLGSGNLSEIGAVLILMLRSLSYGQNLQNSFASMASLAPYVHQVEDAIDSYTHARATDGDLTPDRVTPLLLQDVAFSYDPERGSAISGVTLEIGRGECLGIIGPSGSGKSTLVQLLLGLREPTEGAITVDGVPLPRVRRDFWNHRVSFVPQDALLLTGTVAENIRFFRDGLDDEALRRAAGQANFHKDIQGLPDGFRTHIGERGGQLSGGQRQRLSIARALVGGPELLILDEPTSALDGESEALIRRTLSELRGQVTIVLVAHRMSTLDVCDRILVVESGRVTGLDTPANLKHANAFYRNALAIAGIE